MSERFRDKAKALRQELERCGFVLVPAQLVRDCDELIAIELAAAEASALERAAQVCEDCLADCACSVSIRALIPPAAAPAAETGKAQGADGIGYCKTCGLDASHGVCNDPRDELLRECNTALLLAKAQLEQCDEGSIHVDRTLVKLAARAAPTEESTT